MSADNFVVVSPTEDGKWWVTDQSASADFMQPVEDSTWKLGPFADREAALLAAFAYERDHVVEYGVSLCETPIPVMRCQNATDEGVCDVYYHHNVPCSYPDCMKVAP